MKLFKRVMGFLFFCQLACPSAAPNDIFEAIDQNNLAAVKNFVNKDKNVLNSVSKPIKGAWSGNNPGFPTRHIPPLFYALLFSIFNDTIIPQERIDIITYLINNEAPLYWTEQTAANGTVFIHQTALSYLFSLENHWLFDSPERANVALSLTKAILEKDNTPQQKVAWLEINNERVWDVPVIFLMLCASMATGAQFEYAELSLDYLVQKDPSQKNATLLHLGALSSTIKRGRRVDLWAFSMIMVSTTVGNGWLGQRNGSGFRRIHQPPKHKATSLTLHNWLLKQKIDPFRVIPFDEKFSLNLNLQLTKHPEQPIQKGYTYWLDYVPLGLHQAQAVNHLHNYLDIPAVLKKIKDSYPDAPQKFAAILNTKNPDGAYAFPLIGAEPQFALVIDLAEDKVEPDYFKAAKMYASAGPVELKNQKNLERLDDLIAGKKQPLVQPDNATENLERLATSLKQLQN